MVKNGHTEKKRGRLKTAQGGCEQNQVRTGQELKTGNNKSASHAENQ